MTRMARGLARRLAFAAVVAFAGALLPFGNASLAQEEIIKQIELTAKQVEGFISAQKDMVALDEKVQQGSASDQPDPKIKAELEEISKKHGFKDFTDYDDVAVNIAMIMAGIDPDTKKFQQPAEMIQKQIAEINADASITKADKDKMVEELNQALKTTPPIQHAANIKLIESYYDRLESVLQ